ncbi:hypothetical protein [Mycobacterium avium]
MGVKNRWDRPTAVAAWAVLITFTTITCLVNARYATMTGSHVMFHAAIPVAVLVSAVFAEMAALSSAHRWVKAVCVAVLVGIFGTVLVASYLGVLHVFLEWNPNPSPAAERVYHVVAAIPDALMVVSGTVLMSLRMKHPSRSAKPATESRWRRLADAATARAEAALAVPASVEVNAVEEARGGVAEPAVETPPPAVEPPAKPPVETKPAAVEPELEPFMEAAAHIVEEGIVTRKTAEEIAAVIAAVDRGMTDNAVKASGIASASTATKVRAAWRQWQEEREPTLSVVG